jgi:glycosyltransferase involved in cell wall biosynthesis
MGRYLKSHNIQLVHAFDTSTDVFAVAAGRIFMTPVITANLWCRSMVPPLYRRALRVTDHLANAIIVNSDAVRHHLIEDDNTPPNSIYVCHNGVDPQVFAPRPLDSKIPRATLTIGTVCALRAEKRIDLLLDAFAVVRRVQPSMKLLIVGSGEMLAALQAGRKRLNLEEDCVFEPEKRDVADWMRAIDIFVTPSSSESFPNALLEAMGCGCCVIASRVGGIPEMVSHRDNGLLFESGELEGLVSALTTVICDKSLRDRLGREASRTAREHFSIQMMARRMEEIYNTVLANRL